ncbi:MAG: hypothetical protein J0M24_19800 [Verrucomicrobia bacterium]|nr:hypothetical protein [Verrucomicrobiota bacterium]
MKNSPELKNLTRHIQRADAALTALTNFRHDGRPLRGGERVLARALADAERAGEIAKAIREAVEQAVTTKP